MCSHYLTPEIRSSFVSFLQEEQVAGKQSLKSQFDTWQKQRRAQFKTYNCISSQLNYCMFSWPQFRGLSNILNNSTIVLRFHRKSSFLTSQVNVVSIHVWFKSGLSQRVFSWLQSATCNTQFKSYTPSLKSEHDVH